MTNYEKAVRWLCEASSQLRQATLDLEAAEQRFNAAVIEVEYQERNGATPVDHRQGRDAP
jgi:hypothetical protein